MVNTQLRSVLWQVHMSSSEGLADATDGQLLERFSTRQEEAAFAALLHRHGPMVLSVARRVLRHVQDAEDVLQAPFPILARQARAIPKPHSVASYLHQLAHPLALYAT